VLLCFSSVDDEAASPDDGAGSPDDEDDYDFIEDSFSSTLFLSLYFFFESLHARHVFNVVVPLLSQHRF
jgi:hypothetical protein